jgi:hypothetical protein
VFTGIETETGTMTDTLEGNKQTVMAFYDLMFK